MTTLYRKYRPQTFSTLVGQDIIVQTLTNELISGTIAQSYLFYGPRGTGKTTTARLLAKAINCTTRAPGTFEPCQTCSSCTEITQSRNVDVIEIDAASQTGIDNVRENIIDNAQFKPTRSKYKIFIIDEVHMLSNSAFNALLKTIEEPPAHVVFILATTELHKLPATIVSRCQRFTFKKISHSIMKARLIKLCADEQLTVDNEVLERIIAKSDGGLRDAESLLGQIATLSTDGHITIASVDNVLPASSFSSVLEILQALSTKNAHEALRCIQSLAAEGVSFEQVLTETIEAVRAILHLAITTSLPKDSYEITQECHKKLTELSKIFTPNDLTSLLDICLKRRQDSRYSPIAELPLELVVTEFCFPTQTSTIPAAGPQKSPSTSTATSTSSFPSPLTPPQQPPTTTKTVDTVATPSTALKTDSSKLSTPLTTAGAVSSEELNQLWKKIVEWVGTKSHSLTFILNTAKILTVSHDRVTLGVPYDFHRDKLSEAKNKKLVEQAIHEITHTPLLITCETVQNNSSQPTKIIEPSADVLDSLASSFGGEVIASP